MSGFDLLLSATIAHAQLRETLARVSGLPRDSISILTTIEQILDEPPGIRLRVVAHEKCGEFRLHLAVDFMDEDIDGPAMAPVMARALAGEFGVACLMDDGSVDPSSFIQVARGQADRRVFLSMAMLEMEIYVLADDSR